MAQTRVRQRVYGLVVEADILLHGLDALPEDDTAPADVQVHLAALPAHLDATIITQSPVIFPPRPGTGGLVIRHVSGHDCFHMRYADGVEFILHAHGHHVWARWPATFSAEYATAYLLGPVFAFLLRVRGTVCLHASAVSLDGRALVFVGPEGAGKSTTAAALALRGIPLLSDDIVPLHAGTSGIEVVPGSPLLRLWQETATALGAADRSAPLAPAWDKVALDVRQKGLAFAASAAPLGAVYLLGERAPGLAGPAIDPVPPRTALLALITNTLAAGVEVGSRASDLALLARVVQEARVRAVRAAESADGLSALCDAILADARAPDAALR